VLPGWPLSRLPHREELILSGPLLSDDGSLVLGAGVLLEAPDADRARSILPEDRAGQENIRDYRRPIVRTLMAPGDPLENLIGRVP
jgi:hypothetical protein